MTEINTNEIAKRFKDARTIFNKNGYESLRCVSEKTGVSKSLIYNIEHCKQECGFKSVIKLANHYSVSVNWLLCQSEENHLEFPSELVNSLNKINTDMFNLSCLIENSFLKYMKGEYK